MEISKLEEFHSISFFAHAFRFCCGIIFSIKTQGHRGSQLAHT